MCNNVPAAGIRAALAALLLAGLGCRFLSPAGEPSPTPIPSTPTAPPPQCNFTPTVGAYNQVHEGSSATCQRGVDYLYQSFLASSGRITSVSILLRAGGSLPAGGYISHLALRDCQVDGPVLAETEAIVPGGLDVGEQVRVPFDLSEPLEVPVGRRIVIQWSSPVEGAKYVSWMFSKANPYPDGYSLGCTGKPVLAEDLVFDVSPH